MHNIWSHGSISQCSFPGCDKGARDRYFCTAHGGGKRVSFCVNFFISICIVVLNSFSSMKSATSRIVTKRHVVDLSSALPTVEENG